MFRWMFHRAMWSAMRAPFRTHPNKKPIVKEQDIKWLPFEKWCMAMFCSLVLSIAVAAATGIPPLGVALFIVIFLNYRPKA